MPFLFFLSKRLIFAFGCDIMHTTEYERAVRFLGKAFNREERICSTAPATVRTLLILFTASAGRIKFDEKHQGVVSRETCRTFAILRFFEGMRESGFFALAFFPCARKIGTARKFYLGGVIMKRKLASLLTLMLTLLLFVGCFASCITVGKANAVVVETTQTLVVICVNETDENATLFDVMENLQKENALQFELAGTMLKSLNGVENAADFSSCWMLYTSDAEMSNTEWGTYDYGKVSCSSAVLGGDALIVSAGEYYVWVYTTF